MNRMGIIELLTLLTIAIIIFPINLNSVKSVSPVYQETIVVDINGNGDYISITDAIAHSTATDIIEVKEGIYKENNLKIDKKISIIGEDSSNTIIDCEGKNGFRVESSYVDISNFNIINLDEYAIYIKPGSKWCNISNCIINTTKTQIGIWITASSTTVYNCIIRGINSNGIGIKLQEDASKILDCIIQGYSVGILIISNSNYNSISNCNIFDNEVGIDIRIKSKYNVLSGCNIYSNVIGLNIWLNSNNNSAYLNNYWKNDKDAISKSNNIWDNGINGNYWDDYQGSDADRDGIGDSFYKVDQDNVDRYPLISMILPEKITIPTNAKLITSRSDNTPTFSWNPSVYSKGIKGYYVKIDSEPAVFIGKQNKWTSTNILSNGVHTFYLKAMGNDNTTSDYVIIPFSVDIYFQDEDNDGWSDEEEEQYETDPNDPDNYPLDTDRDRIPNSIDFDDDNDGYSDNIELSYQTSLEKSDEYPSDTDNDYIPDEDSPDKKFVGDIDDDDDGLIDTIELKIGSNSKIRSDVKKIYISGGQYFIIDVSSDGFFDIIYEPNSEKTTAVERDNESYLIDINGDGNWDYVYSNIDGSIGFYKDDQNVLPVSVLIFLAVLMAACVLIFLIKYMKNKDGKKGEKSSDVANILTRETQLKKPCYVDNLGTKTMLADARNLLQNIQNDVSLYLDKLSKMDEQIQFKSVTINQESSLTKETSKNLCILDIEKEVDKFPSSRE